CRSGLAELHLREGTAQAAIPYLEEAERLAEARGDISRLMEIDRRWAEVYLSAGDIAHALTKIEDALAKARALEEPILEEPIDEALSLRTRGQILRAANDIAGALEDFEQSWKQLEAAGDRYEAARTRAEWGRALSDSGDIEGDRLLQEARETFERLGARHDL